MRKVKVFKWEKEKEKPHYNRVYDFEGLFHEWGVDFQGFQDNAGNFSTAIVEKSDGSIVSIEATMIQFINPELLTQDKT